MQLKTRRSDYGFTSLSFKFQQYHGEGTGNGLHSLFSFWESTSDFEQNQSDEQNQSPTLPSTNDKIVIMIMVKNIQCNEIIIMMTLSYIPSF